MSNDFTIEIAVDYFDKDGNEMEAGWFSLPLTNDELKRELARKYPDFDDEYVITDFECDASAYNQELYNIGNLASWNRLFHFINDNYMEDGYDVFEYAYINGSSADTLDDMIDYAETIMNYGHELYDYDRIGGEEYSDLAYYLAKDGAFSREELLNFVDLGALGNYISDDFTACEHGFMRVDQ